MKSYQMLGAVLASMMLVTSSSPVHAGFFDWFKSKPASTVEKSDSNWDQQKKGRNQVNVRAGMKGGVVNSGKEVYEIDKSVVLTPHLNSPCSEIVTVIGGSDGSNLWNPNSVAVDDEGNIYTSVPGRIVKRAPDGVVSNLIGDGLDHDGVQHPTALAIGPDGSLYFADAGAHVVRRVNKNGTTDLIAGLMGQSGYSGDNGPANEAKLNLGTTNPPGIGFDYDGNLYILDSGNLKIRKVGKDGIIRTIAGGGKHGVVTGAGLEVDLYGAQGNLVSYGNFLVFANFGWGQILALNLITSEILSLGTGFYYPYSVAVAPDGTLFISDRGGDEANPYSESYIYSYDTISKVKKRVVGAGKNGFSGDGGPAIGAQIDRPMGVVFDKGGDLFFADQSNARVRRVSCAFKAGKP